jgi:hypothetical protein
LDGEQNYRIEATGIGVAEFGGRLAFFVVLTVGTDRQNPLLRWSVIGSIGVVVFFTAYRAIGPGRAASIRAAGKTSVKSGEPKP